MNPTHRLRRVRAVLVVAIAGLAPLIYWMTRPSTASLVADARGAIQRGDLETGLELALRALEEDPASIDALLVAATAHKRLEDPQRALECWRRLPEEADGPAVVRALKDAGQLAIRAGRASEAEYFYRRALALAPDDLLIHRRLSALYLGQARRWESAPHLFALVSGREFTLEELAFLGNLEELYDAEQLSDFFQDAVPEDLAPRMGEARLLLFKSFPDEGEELLRKILDQRPDLIEAQAQLGVVLVSESRDRDYLAWHQRLPREAETHPEVWWVRATHARKHGNSHGAIRCAWEALRLDPNHLGATYQLAQLLAAEGRVNDAQVFSERAAALEAFCAAIHDILLRDPTADRMRTCAVLAEQLGRLWEAWAWQVALETYHPDEAAPEERLRLRALLTPQTPQTLPEQNLASVYDLSSYPLPDWSSVLDSDPRSGGNRSQTVRFVELTNDAGLDFQYNNGAPADRPGLMIYQSIGGGVCAVDYDRDNFPDLFFPQASASSPLEPADVESADRLYRNASGRALDTTEAALPPDAGYGFGASVGDFDGDGFSDLYVANARRNRLLRNNGDGTFSDVTDAAGLRDDAWTASCLLADLNGDGLPDIYDVNYCAGEGPFTHVCLRPDGRTTRTCIPTEFAAADDRLLVNLGDGRFSDAGEAAGILAPDGRGLGILAAQLDDQPGLDLYIANDMTANFLFLNRTPSPGASPLFEERGVISGTAYDSDGRSQASMGIAADDSDGNGLIDLFLTHFYNESNTLYRQQPGHFFVDQTREAELRLPSMQTLGFGTQFLDVDLNGWPDLFVANGHVDDFTENEIPYRMTPQVFMNLEGTFVDISTELTDSFFTTGQIGRGMARLDWDRDGRDDVAVSRLLDPASLVVNRTEDVGRFLGIRLTGRSQRDAIGTEVHVTADGRTWVKQLTAGDGFECSNERRVLFGLGNSTAVEQVRILWDRDVEQIFTDLPVNCELRFVEGIDRPFLLDGGADGD